LRRAKMAKKTMTRGGKKKKTRGGSKKR